jgi:ribonuclease P protein component
VSVIPKGKFPKSAHLLKHADFQRVYKQGKRHFSGNMTVFFLRATAPIAGPPAMEPLARTGASERNGVRFGFTVSRALGGAVDRNRIRRRVREAVRRHMTELAGVAAPLDVVINPKRTARDAEFETLSDEITRAFQVIQRSLAGAKGSLGSQPSPERDSR